MRLFITGGTGFVGTHFLQLALAMGHDVVAQRRPGSQPRLALAQEPQWLDVALDAVKPAHLESVDALVHFASVGVSPQRACWYDMLHWNVVVQTELLRAAQCAGVRRLVLAGSFAEYGLAAAGLDRIPPSAPLLPISGYAASKACGFVAAHGFAVEHQLELAYLRIFSAFGEGQFAENFWPLLRAAALSGADFEMTSGEQIRDYIPVADVAAAFLRATTRQDISAGVPRIVNVGSGRPISMRSFAEHWWREWGARGRLKVGALPYRNSEAMRFVPDISDDAGE